MKIEKPEALRITVVSHSEYTEKLNSNEPEKVGVTVENVSKKMTFVYFVWKEELLKWAKANEDILDLARSIHAKTPKPVYNSLDYIDLAKYTAGELRDNPNEWHSDLIVFFAELYNS